MTEPKAKPVAATEAMEAVADSEVAIVTTAAGTLDSSGIVKVGERRVIPITAFSAQWMRPETRADADKIAAHREPKQ